MLCSAGRALAENQRQREDDGAQHQHPHQLDHRAGLRGDGAEGRGGGQNLRDRINGQTGQGAVLHAVQVDQAAQQRQGQNHDHAEHGGEGDGGGDFFSIGVDDGGDGGDGGVAADGVAAGDQQGHTRVQAQGAADA